MPKSAGMSSIKLDVTLHDLAAIREFVKTAAVRAGLDADKVHEVVVAVDEAVTNIIVHGYRRKPGPLEVEAGARKNAFVVRLRDEAPPFDPASIPAPDTTLPVDERPIGGMGVYLIKRAMDKMAHRALPGGGNELTLTIKL